MDNVEIVEFLKKERESFANVYRRLYGDDIPPPLRRVIDFYTAAIAAVNKQTPKPVRYNNRHGDGMDYWNKDYFNCPRCGRRLRNKKPDPYCPRCGQALTWEVSV